MASNADNHDDEIWKSLFGGNNEDNNNNNNNNNKSQTKGYSTLVTKKEKNKKRAAAKSNKSSSHRKPSSSHHRSSSSSHTRSHSNTAQKSAINADGPSTAERLSQFLCTPRNRVKLPPPPLKCKFLKMPHQKDRFIKFNATNLELNYKWELHHDSLFPIPLDLMDPDYYNPLKHHSSDSDDDVMEGAGRREDERILQELEDREFKKTYKEEAVIPEQEAFLLQTQYLTGGKEFELTESQRKGYDESDRRRKKSKKNKRGRRGNNDEDSDGMDYDLYTSNIRKNPHSLENVKQTFSDVQDITTHPERGVEVAKIFDVFPNELLLDIDWEHVQFDDAPQRHTKKLSFLNEHKFEAERMKNAELCTQNALLRCVDKKGLEKERRAKLENEDDDNGMDVDQGQNSRQGPDWFSLYGSNGAKKKIEDEDESVLKYEWAAEYVPVHIKKDNLHFMVVPKQGTNEFEDGDVLYATFNNRINLRHRPTDNQNVTPGVGKKGLSEEDKRFFKMQPFKINMTVPNDRTNDSD